MLATRGGGGGGKITTRATKVNLRAVWPMAVKGWGIGGQEREVGGWGGEIWEVGRRDLGGWGGEIDLGGWGGDIKERCGRVGRGRGKMVYSRRIGHTTVGTMHTHTHTYTLHKNTNTLSLSLSPLSLSLSLCHETLHFVRHVLVLLGYYTTMKPFVLR